MANETKVTCPKCGNEIDVNSILSHQLEESFKQKYNTLILEDRKKFETENSKLEKLRIDLANQKEKQDNLVSEKVNLQLKAEKDLLEKQIKARINDEQAEMIASFEKELKEKSEQVRDLNRTRSEVEKLKREKEELKENIEAEAQKMINKQISEEKEKIKKFEQEKNELLVRELQKQLEDQKKLTEEMKRKQEQGSMQLQGEVQELAIEEWLDSQFRYDTISEIKKGDRGADCLQTVHTPTKQNCGTIYYESKRTKDFNKNWLTKFKDDIREKGANIGVLVTDAYPKELERMGLIDGIWVCSYEEFKGLCFVLRESIIQLSLVASSQENKGEKMVMLYDFLTSNEFILQVEGIVEGFTQMQHDLNAEKRSIMGHWKKREKQIQKVLLNTTHMYSSIKGIAGNAIQSINILELPEATNEDLEEED